MSTASIGVVSHVLPPSPSGQAIVLFRLLSGIAPLELSLISRECHDYTANYRGGSAKLAAKYHTLKPSWRLRGCGRIGLVSLGVAINTVLDVLSRAKQIKDIARRDCCELLIACSGDLADLPAAWLACRLTGVSFAPYMFDDYVYQWTGFQRFFARLLEPLMLKNAEAVIVPNEFMAEEYRKRYGSICCVVHNPCNMPNLGELDSAPKVFPENEISVVYAGSIYHAHYDAFHNLLVAIRNLNRSDIKVHLYTSQSESELAKHGICGPFVIHHDHINEAEIPRILHNADVLFLPLAFGSVIPEVIRTSSPGKTGEYLAVGKAILVHAPADSFVSDYFKKYECGLVVDENDPAALSAALSRLISERRLRMELGDRARLQAERDFSVENALKTFKGMLEQVRRARSAKDNRFEA